MKYVVEVSSKYLRINLVCILFYLTMFSHLFASLTFNRTKTENDELGKIWKWSSTVVMNDPGHLPDECE
jgi:hypothetical protein